MTNNYFRNLLRFVATGATLSLLIGCGGETEGSDSDSGSTQADFSSLSAPANFDFAASESISVTISVQDLDGNPNIGTKVFVYESAVDASIPDEESLDDNAEEAFASEEVFADPESLLASGITNASGQFTTTVAVQDQTTSLVLSTAAMGFQTIAEVDIESAAVSHTFGPGVN